MCYEVGIFQPCSDACAYLLQQRPAVPTGCAEAEGDFGENLTKNCVRARICLSVCVGVRVRFKVLEQTSFLETKWQHQMKCGICQKWRSHIH